MTTAKSGFASKLRTDLASGTGPIAEASINAGGTGYSVDDVLTVTGGGGSSGQYKVTSVSGGVVDGITWQSGGSGYSVTSGAATTVSPPGGTGCTLDLDRIFNDVAELASISRQRGLDLIPATNMDSTAGFEEFIAGVGRGGPISCEGNFLNDTVQNFLIDEQESKNRRRFQIYIPSTTTLTETAYGYIEDISPNGRYDEQLGFSATIMIDGLPIIE
jgi:hypothetical protein